ncbi:hypothetical protein HOE22_12695 [Candidatus Woesearchaeota archaeon]|jgi:hypothetical protein|nr:hypothetical protein [Candidatus Woesearchaeota archaeon]MBT7557244.1 hypothetical protein [Candidatus Woesearchaeota archaeon]
MEFKNRLNLVVDLNADKTKIYNGLSPTKIPEDTYPYGAIFARHDSTQYCLCYIQNLLEDRIMYEYVDSDTLDEMEFDSKWIYVLEPIGDPNGWSGNRESQIQKLFNKHFDESSSYDSIDSLLCGVSDNVLNGVRNNKGIILLYLPYEGYDPIQYQMFEAIHKELKDKKISFENFCYVTGNQKADKQYEQWRGENDIEDKFHIICYNDEECYPFWKEVRNKSKYTKYKPEKYFLCYNRRPHIHRLVLASLLEKNNLIDKGLMSFPDESFAEGFPDKSVIMHKLSNMIVNVEDMEEVLKYYKKFKSRLPLLVDTETLDENLWFNFDMIPYKKTFFSVVVETLYNEDSIFIDEKVWKAIDATHPFIFVGNHHGLKKLKELGYRTFHPYINEEYDNIEDSMERMKSIVKEIKRLTDLSFDEWYVLKEKLNPILEWNRKCKIKRDGGAISFLNRILEIL